MKTCEECLYRDECDNKIEDYERVYQGAVVKHPIF